MRIPRFLWLLPLGVWLHAFMAFGATETAKTQSWWQTLLMPLVSLLGMVLATFASYGILKIIRLIEAKWKIDVPVSIENLLMEKTRVLVSAAEELAENRLLYGDGQKTPGAEKLQTALDQLETAAKQLGVNKTWTRDKLEQLVLGILHIERNETTGPRLPTPNTTPDTP